jgi:tRNA(Ile)-lysidine synthase
MSLIHQVSKDLRELREQGFLLALSGGLDSMALFYLFIQLREQFHYSFAVAHFFHGESSDPVQNDYRHNALHFVQHHCQKHDVPFFSNKLGAAIGDGDGMGPELTTNGPLSQRMTTTSSSSSSSPSSSSSSSSEASLRERRYQFLRHTLSELGMGYIVLGHHRDDLLETRMIRLIRGTGPQGLSAMELCRPPLVRPLLGNSRTELEEFVKGLGGAWVEDPSNDNQDPLRNWMRKNWLPQLEEKQPGALNSLARSLDLLAESAQEMADEAPWKACLDGGQVVLSEFFCLGPIQQRLVIANYMKSQGLGNYGLSHVNEVLKRLDTEKKRHTFYLLGRCWKVDAGRMSVTPSA